ncbi:MAG: type II toxin-antitoxin system RelE/ParE family toxin [Gammaproteobacteria bacterium]|nr:type II toxin-antitoxin system RelE/ParE family toxin [Gammaproteobacteria bacterium]
MPNYYLRREAHSDLRKIAQFTKQRWGVEQRKWMLNITYSEIGYPSIIDIE